MGRRGGAGAPTAVGLLQHLSNSACAPDMTLTPGAGLGGGTKRTAPFTSLNAVSDSTLLSDLLQVKRLCIWRETPASAA
jgi:hypothetical protein